MWPFSNVGGPSGPPNLPAWPGASPPRPPSLISLNMSLVGYVTWKCILSSDLKTPKVITISGSEHLGSVHYFRI